MRMITLRLSFVIVGLLPTTARLPRPLLSIADLEWPSGIAYAACDDDGPICPRMNPPVIPYP